PSSLGPGGSAGGAADCAVSATTPRTPPVTPTTATIAAPATARERRPTAGPDAGTAPGTDSVGTLESVSATRTPTLSLSDTRKTKGETYSAFSLPNSWFAGKNHDSPSRQAAPGRFRTRQRP